MTLPTSMGIHQTDHNIDYLPKGWALTSLRDVCEINPPKASKNFLASDDPVTFIPMPSVDADEGAITKPQIKKFSEVRKGFTCFRENDVIMAKITPCMENGKAAIATKLTNGLGFGSTEFHVLRSTGAVLPEFVYQFIRQDSYRRAAETEMTGSVGQKRVPRSFLEETEFQLPPLSEQFRIVERVKELSASLKNCRKHLSRVPAILKRFRQSVLAAACSGRLTEDWREGRTNLESIESQYERAQRLRAEHHEKGVSDAFAAGRRKPNDPRKSERSNKPVIGLSELPKTWGLYPLQDLSYVITDGTHKTPTYQDEGVAFLSVKNVRPFRIVDANVKRISEEEHREITGRCNPATGDILYTKVGTFGYAAANRLSYPFSLFVSVALIKPVRECLTTEYAELVLNSDFVYAQAADRVSGSGVPTSIYLK